MANAETPKKRGPKVIPMAETQPPPKLEPKKQVTFFAKVKEIPREDWGKRAWIYVYCLEPICDLKRGGENKYLVKLGEPLADEDPIMHDYGSGKYRLNLVYRKPAANLSDQLDVTEIEIYNPKYPPKIPRSTWMNDSRNERWAALLPPEPPKPTESASILETMKTLSSMRQDMREELAPQSGSDDVTKFTAMATAFKSIMPQPVAADTAANTVAIGIQMAQTLLQMKADNPMVDVMRDELKAIRDELKLEREANRRLMEKQNTGTGGLEQLLEKSDEWIPKIKGLLNLGGDKLTEVVHGRPRAWWQELLLQIGPPVFNNLAPALPMLINNMARGPQAPAGLNGNGAPPQAPNPAQPQLAAPQANPLQIKVGQFLYANIGPLQATFEDFMSGKLRDTNDPEAGRIDGTDFAANLCDYHGKPGEQSLMEARTLGSGAIMQMLKGSQFWPYIQPHEAKMMEFIDQVLSYRPEPEPDEDAPADYTKV